MLQLEFNHSQLNNPLTIKMPPKYSEPNLNPILFKYL